MSKENKNEECYKAFLNRNKTMKKKNVMNMFMAFSFLRKAKIK